MEEEVPSRTSKELQKETMRLLQESQQAKNYDAEQMCAALVDFYCWTTQWEGFQHQIELLGIVVMVLGLPELFRHKPHTLKPMIALHTLNKDIGHEILDY
jgi:hypothetical protein